MKDRVYVSTSEGPALGRDDARSWEAIDPRSLRGVQGDAASPDVLYGVTPAAIVESTDAGRTWKALDTPAPGIFPVGVLPHPQRAGVVFVGPFCLGQQGCGIFRSSDGGSTWHLSISAPASLPAYGASGLMYARSTQGLYISSDDGLTSREARTPAALDSSLSADPVRAGVVYLGNYRSGDRGATWTEMPLNIRASDIAFDSRTGATWACEFDVLFRSTDGGLTWTEHAKVPRCFALGALA
ncbi:MAG TPA: hypothetical protein VFL57_03615, partial [Bryobacteraceae bacterium]|nr:hypothetical protein [Bryobacteraceae bacterium]